jgi:hypothetical protein
MFHPVFFGRDRKFSLIPGSSPRGRRVKSPSPSGRGVGVREGSIKAK